MIITIVVSTLSFKKLTCQTVLNMFGKLVTIIHNYHIIGQLLLLTIIVSNKNWTTLNVVKENNFIMVNRQNQLIAHPYLPPTLVHLHYCQQIL